MRRFLTIVFAVVLASSQSDSAYASKSKTKIGSINVASVNKSKNLTIVNPKAPTSFPKTPPIINPKAPPSIPKTPPIVNPKGPVGLPGHPIARGVVRHALFHPHTHVGWRHHCWIPAHRCYGYYCPTNSVWFYYCESQGCYLPITSIAMYPPTPVVNVTVNVNVVPMPGAPALPTGAVYLPQGVTPPAR